MNVRVLDITESTVQKEFKRLGVHREGMRRMLPKSRFFVVRVDSINARQANVIKQEMLAAGGDAAVPYGALNFEPGPLNVILLGTLKHYERFVEKMKIQPFGLDVLARKLVDALRNFRFPPQKLSTARAEIDLCRPLVVGILNVTPDSFFDGGKYFDFEKAIMRAEQMVEEGADIIDVGGQSSRPGSSPVSEDEEKMRVLPVIRELSKRLKIPISCDTYRPGVARSAIEEGATIINDIYAMRYEKEMADVISTARCAVVLMHMQGTPETMQKNPQYSDVIGEIFSFFEERLEYALNCSIPFEKIIIDPGIGFGKLVEHNLEIIQRLREFTTLGRPIMLGVSRKMFLGRIAGNVGPEARMPPGIAACVVGYLKGAQLFRVHDVKEMRMALDAAAAIENYENTCS